MDDRSREEEGPQEGMHRDVSELGVKSDFTGFAPLKDEVFDIKAIDWK